MFIKIDKMLNMLRSLTFLLLPLLLSSVWATTEKNVEQHLSVVTSYPGRSNLIHFSDMRYNHNYDKDNTNDDYDYYGDKEKSDSVNIDIDINYAAYKHKKSNRISASLAATTTTPSFENLKRVPRHPHHVLNDNRLDSDAAFDDEEGFQSDQPVGALTAQKEREVGTPEGVQKSKQYYTRRNQWRMLAAQHRQRMEVEAACRWPQRRVHYMRNETNFQYSPIVTILHRCDEHTGCCSDNYVCSVKTMTTVELPFVVKTPTIKTSEPMMIKLDNHTECECIPVFAQRNKRSSHCHCPKHFYNFSNLRWLRGNGLATGCRCDCHLSDATCQRMKNGEEGFAMSERTCIMRNECSQPICNYGVYDSKNGRCPRPLQQQQQQQQRQLGFG